MIRFLTRWPLPERWARTEFSAENFVRGMKWLPLVGALVGLPATLSLWLVLRIGGDVAVFVGPFLAVALHIWAGGSLHLDGLADTADALLSNRPPEQALAIMRDSAVGAGGVIAIVLDILGKWALLAGILAASGARPECAVAALIAPVCGRMALVWHAAAARYARSGPGLGAFVDRVGYRQAAAATLVALALTAPPLFLLFDAAPLEPLALLVLCPVALALLFARYLTKRLGGITGDTMGATIELAELAALLIVTLALA